MPADYYAPIDGIAVGYGVGSCGTAATTGNPVIAADIATDPLWADFRDLALRHGLRACWSMPIRAADGRLLGTFANYYRQPKEPTERDLETIGMVTRTTAIAIERSIHEQARERAEAQRGLLLRELNHRVKNVFALADSLLVMSARSVTSVEEYSTAVRGRLQTLTKAHELVQPRLSESEPVEPTAVPLGRLVADILEPYAQPGSKNFCLTGPDV